MKTFNPSLLSFLLVIGFASSSFSLQHEDLMWGLKNTGKTINIDLDPLQAYRLRGVPGEDIHLLPASNGRKVKVAIVDTGIDTNHPDLKDFILRDKNKCAAYEKFLACIKEDNAADDVATPIKKKNEKDKKTDPLVKPVGSKMFQCRQTLLTADAEVYPADCVGWSILDGDLNGQPTANNILGRPDFTDAVGHGTHVAGTVLSVTKNIQLIPVQVIGIGPNAPIKPFSVDLSPNENVRGGYNNDVTLSSRVARGIIYAITSGAEVINLSLGWQEDQNSDIIRDAIMEAQRRNIIIVAAAGNDSTSAILRPCQFKNVICVAAARPDGALASFSNFGMGVDIAAPGVEILSTIPMNLSSIRLPGFAGYDYLSGTSQATPFVTGVVAEMLSRGVPAAEIYPRLILGARPVQAELPVIKGPVNSTGTPVNAQTSYKKTIVSGLIDMQRSMQVTPQALLLPADKETQIINWDRQSANLSFQFNIKNYWKSLDKAVTIQVRSTLVSDIEPAIIKAAILKNDGSWEMGAERTVKIDLQIRDNKNPSLSRMPRELSYQIYVMVDGKVLRQFEVKAEVIATFSKDIADPDVVTIPIVGTIPQGMSLTPVDEVYDNDQLTKDYFITGLNDKDKTLFDIGLVKMINGHYEIRPVQSIKFAGNLEQWRPKYKLRMDIDGDGKSEYVFGVIEYLDKDLGINGPYRNHFYIFDSDMHLKQTGLFDDKRLTLPYVFYWMKVGQNMRPAFVTKGPEIKRKWDITDLWSLDKFEDVKTEKDIRLYYLDENFKLAHTEADPESRIVDVIQPTISQVKAGVLPVLIARNLGTEVKPSYLNEFSVGEVQNARLMSQRKISVFNSDMSYRNLVDTMNDRAFSINTSATEFKGSMWYGLDAHKKQRVTLLDLEQSKIFDKLVNSQREVFDAALQIRAGFQSNDRRGVFLMTNSEIEYHDLIGTGLATGSLDRYTFYGDNTFIQLHSPITILDRLFPGQKLPGLYTSEGSGVNRGIKMMVPIYSSKGLLQKIVSPARLSFKAAIGCKSLANPLFMGEGSGYALDYYCGDQMKRLLLKY